MTPYPNGSMAPVNGVALESIPDPQPGTLAHERAMQRDQSSRSIAAMPWLPQLPDAWATDIYERIEDYERRLVAPHLQSNEYTEGTATEADQIAEVGAATDGPLLTAEHATRTVRLATGKLGYPDTGTAGLAALLAEETGRALIMRGRQTGNAATDSEHPLKERARFYLSSATGYLSVHGMGPGKFVLPHDSPEVQAIVGLGAEPTEVMRDFAQKIARIGREALGLYVIAGNDQSYFVQKPGETALKRGDDDQPYIGQMAALKPNTMTNFVRRELNSLGRAVPAFQVELTNLLRLTPEDTNTKDRKTRIIGTALGYQLLKMTLETAKTYTIEADQPHEL